MSFSFIDRTFRAFITRILLHPKILSIGTINACFSVVERFFIGAVLNISSLTHFLLLSFQIIDGFGWRENNSIISCCYISHKLFTNYAFHFCAFINCIFRALRTFACLVVKKGVWGFTFNALIIDEKWTIWWTSVFSVLFFYCIKGDSLRQDHPRSCFI